MESSEHNWANTSETICPEMLVFGKQAFGCFSFQNILTNPIISQINTSLLPYLISYYSSAFTINQFHNHDAEVYAPQRLVSILNSCLECPLECTLLALQAQRLSSSFQLLVQRVYFGSLRPGRFSTSVFFIFAENIC